jgi:hypothetical protein
VAATLIGDTGDGSDVFAVVGRGGHAIILCKLPVTITNTLCPILSNTTSAGVVNTTEEKVPNDEQLMFYNTHTWVKKKEKRVGRK